MQIIVSVLNPVLFLGFLAGLIGTLVGLFWIISSHLLKKPIKSKVNIIMLGSLGVLLITLALWALSSTVFQKLFPPRWIQ